jgi:protein phosphatase
MTLTLRYAARSDRGLIRSGNQDSVYAGPRLLAVADGMGGMAAGDVASNIVIAAMAPLDEDVPGSSVVDALRGAVELANQQIRDAVDANPALEGMGTTLTAMLFTGSKIAMVHIGDSRAYLLRDGEFTQVTKDDTYVQMLVDEGRITAEEAGSHPQRHLLYRAIQGDDMDPEFSVRQVHNGDRYLLCSDGLSGVVSDETIANTLREYSDPQQCAERLVQLALRGGGPDNITVVVADITNAKIGDDRPVVGGAAALDRGNATSADQSMSAARASALASPRPPAPGTTEEDAGDNGDERPRRRPALVLIMLLVLVGLLGGVLWYSWSLTQSKYYVGKTDDGVVAIYRGVPGQIAGLRLSSVEVRTGTQAAQLTQVAQDRLEQGIPADNLPDAKRKLTELLAAPGTGVNCAGSSVAALPSLSGSGGVTGAPTIGGSATPSVSVPLTPAPPTSGSSGQPSLSPSATATPTPSCHPS